MDRNTLFFNVKCVRFVRWKKIDSFGKPKSLSDLACGVVITGDDVNRDLSFPQLTHLRYKIKTRIVVLPVTVV